MSVVWYPYVCHVGEIRSSPLWGEFHFQPSPCVIYGRQFATGYTLVSLWGMWFLLPVIILSVLRVPRIQFSEETRIFRYVSAARPAVGLSLLYRGIASGA
jgi:hypothetical protein